MLWDDDDDPPPRRRRRRRVQDEPRAEDSEEDGAGEPELETFDGPLRERLAEPAVERAVKKRFARFLHRYTPPNAEPSGRLYRHQLLDLCLAAEEHNNFDVSYSHLSSFDPTLAIWLADAPAQMLPLFDEVGCAALLKLSRSITAEATQQQVYVRITSLPIHDAIRDLRRMHFEALVKTSGLVTHCSGIFQQLLRVVYDCNACGAFVEPQSGQHAGACKPASCRQCKSGGPFSVNEAQSQLRRYQTLTLQERPGDVPAGRMPRCVAVVLMRNLIGCALPGGEVEVTGTYLRRFDKSLNIAAVCDYEAALVANYVHRVR